MFGPSGAIKQVCACVSDGCACVYACVHVSRCGFASRCEESTIAHYLLDTRFGQPARFIEEEAQILSAFKHENILPLIGLLPADQLRPTALLMPDMANGKLGLPGREVVWGLRVRAVLPPS